MPVQCREGGGCFSPYTWSHDRETDGQHDTCHRSAGRPSTLLEIITHFDIITVSKYTLYIIILTGEDDKTKIDPGDTMTVK